MADNDDKKKESKTNGSLFENLENLRIGQNFSDAIGVKKQITTIPIRKPNRQDFIRVHNDESYYLETVILEIKEDRALYWLGVGAQPSEPVQRILDKLGTSERYGRLRQGESLEALLEEAEQAAAEREPVDPRTKREVVAKSQPAAQAVAEA